jgi:hypothetical protein
VQLSRGVETITFQPNTVAAIFTRDTLIDRKTEVAQQTGTLDLEIEKRDHPHTTVQTPFLAAVVKGTIFEVTVTKKNAKVSVARGLVQVSSFASGQQANVGPKQSASVDAVAGMTVSGAMSTPSITAIAKSVSPIGQPTANAPSSSTTSAPTSGSSQAGDTSAGDGPNHSGSSSQNNGSSATGGSRTGSASGGGGTSGGSGSSNGGTGSQNGNNGVGNGNGGGKTGNNGNGGSAVGASSSGVSDGSQSTTSGKSNNGVGNGNGGGKTGNRGKGNGNSSDN